MQEKGKKFGNIKKLLYICSQFGNELRNYEGEVDKFGG